MSDEVLHRLEKQLDRLESFRGAGGVQQFMMAPPTNDERSAHKAEKVAIGLACLLVGLLISGWSLANRMAADIDAERARAEAHAAWAREEAQIVRSYIWQGKVPPLNPYPKPEPRK